MLLVYLGQQQVEIQAGGGDGNLLQLLHVLLPRLFVAQRLDAFCPAQLVVGEQRLLKADDGGVAVVARLCPVKIIEALHQRGHENAAARRADDLLQGQAHL